MTREEENLIYDAVLEFHNNGTPLSRCIFDLSTALISKFVPECQMHLGFQNNVPGKKWLFRFLDRNKELTFKRSSTLECVQQKEINPENVVKHFAILEDLINRYDIQEPTRIFNLANQLSSICLMTVSRTQCKVKRGQRRNKLQINFKDASDHVTLIPVVLAAGQIMKPLVIFSGAEARY